MIEYSENVKVKNIWVHPLEGLFAMLVARGVPAGLLYWGGGALRVRQIGRKLHTEPYGPEQKCTNSAALGPARSPPQMSASGGEASS